MKFLDKNFSQTFPELICFEAVDGSLTSVENQFKGLSKLKYLNLMHNNIENVTGDAFIDLINLEEMDLAENKIQILEEKTFASLKAMKKLHLRDNKIRNFHPGIFKNLVNIEFINLRGNEIEILDDKIFENLADLKLIFIYKNKLKGIPKALFKNNLKLEIIWLHENKIEIIDDNMFDHLLNLKTVDLRSNTCIDEKYNETSLTKMKIELKTNCMLPNLVQTLENTVKDLQKALHDKTLEIKDLEKNIDAKIKIKSEEILAMRKNGEAMAQQIKLLEQKYEALNEKNRLCQSGMK